ncbi:MAG TPA: N-methyl-D-aspartate receptor NMDAR2C subunit [Terriglobia bacterium]|nr:N-methyl-D-aspartate receptor NMDAR2C subunit [Terriglobia bacterium]
MTELSPNRWATVWQSIARRGDGSDWLNRLATLYAESHRHYHTARHIAECLNEFDAARQLARQPVALELALWFHDAIYDTHASDNEEQSAVLSQRCLEEAGAEAGLQTAVRDLVLVTKAHQDSPHPDAPLLVDIDLSILGAPTERFFEYEDQIREEYSWVPEDVFRTKRAEILERFLARAVIFRTSWFFDTREKQARANLRESLKRLRG